MRIKQKPGGPAAKAIALILAAVLLTLVYGCSGEKQDPTYGVTPEQGSSAPQTRGDAPEQAGPKSQTEDDFPYVITTERYTEAALDISGEPNFIHNAIMLQDGDGVIHAVYTGPERTLHHKSLEGGVWSEAETITADAAGYFHPALTPDGELCIAYQRETLFYIAYRSGGVWEEIKSDLGYEGSMYNPYCFAMSREGAPLFLNNRRGQGGNADEYYLNDIQLTQSVEKAYTQPDGKKFTEPCNQGVLPGLGSDIFKPLLTVSPDGTCYLDYLSFDRLYENKDGGWTNLYTYYFSKSADGGKTWSGPYEVCRDVIGETNAQFQTAYAADGTKFIFIPGTEHGAPPNSPLLVIAEVSPAGGIKVGEHFSYDEMYEKIWIDKRYQRIYRTDFYSMKATVAPDGTPHVYGTIYGVAGPDHCHFHLDRDGVWHIAFLDVDGAFIHGAILDENGELALYGFKGGSDVLTYWSKKQQ